MTEILKTVAIDVTHSVFENETVGMMYITKDIYSDSYVVAIPVESFSYQLSEKRIEGDLSELLRYGFGHQGQRERLINAIREGITKIK